jgi:hypothetical protein
MRRLNLGITLLWICGISNMAAAAVVYKGVDQLTAQAEQVVIGDVIDLQCFRTEEGVIRSRITVQVSDYLVGQGSGIEVLEMDGGTIGDTTLSVSVYPVYQVGDHVLLFLHNSETRLVEAFQGSYLTDGQQVVRMSPGCRRIIDEAVEPLPDLLAAVQQALPAGMVLNQPKPYTGSFALPLGQPRYTLCGRSWAYMPNPMGEDYLINANCVDSSAGDATNQRTQVQNGPNAWNGAGADFAFTYGGTTTSTSATVEDGINAIFFSTSPPGAGDYVAINYSYSSGGNMTEFNICYNDRDYTWWGGSGSCYGMMDIWAVATHESGHSLCLADLYGGGDYMKTMYGYVDYCDFHARDLDQDDINGIIAIYGLPPGPENDYCAYATPAATGTFTGSTTTATVDGSASCGSSSSTPDVWFRYTPGSSGTLTLDTCGSAYNTVLSIHTGCPGTSSNQVGGTSGCNNDSASCGAGSQQSYLNVAVTAYNTYYIRISGYAGAEGDYTLHASGPAPDSTAPTPDPMTFNESPSGAPTGTSTSQIAMTATQATDPSGTVEYYFTAITTGGHSCSWQTGRTYTDSGLTTNTPYSYKVKARDAMNNETADSAVASGATFIETPTGISFGTITDTTIRVTALDAFSNLTGGLSGLFFEVTTTDGTPTGGAQANTWVQLSTITASGLSPTSTYRFRVKARNYYGVNETAWYPISGYIEQATSSVDLTPPSPNPMSFQLNPSGAPTPLSTSQIAMTATEATDPSGPVEYFFTASGTGSHSSPWQTSRAYTDTSLQTNRSYSYKVKARDTRLNTTGDSPTVSVATFIETPTGLSVGTVTDTSIQVNALGAFTRLNQNFSGLYFEVTALDGTPVGSGTGVNSWTQLSLSQTATAAGLTIGTNYRFRVKARNYYGQNETPWYPTNGYVYQATTGGVTCSMLGDINQDNLVDGRDIDGFVRAKLGGAPLPGENPVCASYGGTLTQDVTDFVADLLGL